MLKYWQEIQNNTKYHSVFSYKNFSPWSDDNLAHPPYCKLLRMNHETLINI
ncbi:DUF4931 domain-containing protein [Leuconostoc carnosum]|uniref:DUF4931 domain-containing protein n=1 Tax=Leuconostoc carnosum TaxID=1252 RepID=UPI00345C8F45